MRRLKMLLIMKTLMNNMMGLKFSPPQRKIIYCRRKNISLQMPCMLLWTIKLLYLMRRIMMKMRKLQKSMRWWKIMLFCKVLFQQVALWVVLNFFLLSFVIIDVSLILMYMYICTCLDSICCKAFHI